MDNKAVQLIVKRTFLEFVESPASRQQQLGAGRCRAMTEPHLTFSFADDCSTSLGRSSHTSINEEHLSECSLSTKSSTTPPEWPPLMPTGSCLSESSVNASEEPISSAAEPQELYQFPACDDTAMMQQFFTDEQAMQQYMAMQACFGAPWGPYDGERQPYESSGAAWPPSCGGWENADSSAWWQGSVQEQQQQCSSNTFGSSDPLLPCEQKSKRKEDKAYRSCERWADSVPPSTTEQGWRKDSCPQQIARKSDAASSPAANGRSNDDPADEYSTTVMLRNLPNNYTRTMLLELIDAEGFTGKYDFVYLPIDFNSKAGLGYGFVNLTSPLEATKFWKNFEGFSRWALPSDKVCCLNWSRPHQGLEAHIERYCNSPVMHVGVPDFCKPMIFSDGVRVPFPPPTRQVKAPRLRVRN